MDLYEKNNSLLNIVKGVAISIGFTFIALFIFSCLLVYTNINENLMQPIVIVITAISILLGSSIGNKIFLAFYFTKRTFKSDETYSFKAVFRGRIFQKENSFCAKNGIIDYLSAQAAERREIPYLRPWRS